MLPRRLGKQIRIPLQRVPNHHLTILFKVVFEGFQRVFERRKVEAQHDVAMAVFGRLPPQVRAVEDGLKFVGSLAVVVVVQQGHPAGLAHAPGPNQKGIAFLFERVDKTGLIDVEALFQADGAEIGPAVGNARVGCRHGDS